MRKSIEDVAALAGVSITTVSRVINNSPHKVSAATREKVLAAVKELNFQPDISAQSLRQSTANVIALISRDLTDAYYGEMAKGVSEAALQQNILSFICNTGRSPQKELEYHTLFAQYKVRGLILSGGGFNDAKYQEIIQQEIAQYTNRGQAIVALAPQGPNVDPLINSIMIDNIRTGELITEYLIERGHHRILFIGGPKNNFTTHARLQGYKNALKKHNIPFDKSISYHSESFWQDGYSITKDAIQQKKDFTAICCINDNIAISAIGACTESGLSVPNDVSIIGIGGLPNALYTVPTLTTAKIPLYEIGIKAVDVLLNSSPNEIQHIIMNTTIQEGNSVKSI